MIKSYIMRQLNWQELLHINNQILKSKNKIETQK